MISAGAAARGGGLLVMLVVAWPVAARGVTFTPAGAILALDRRRALLTRTSEFGG
ncbi:MAG: hypothetical protein ACREJ9_10780 [Candidatus Rokuibacteriota bacterium]